MADARSEILMALRLALTDCPDPGPAPRPGASEAFGPDDPAALAAACARCGVRLLPVPDWAGARAAVAGLLRELGVRSAAIQDHPDLAPLDLPGLCATLGVEVIPVREESIRDLARADIGITSALGLLAESGSILVAAGADAPRSISLLPETHLAVVPPGRTVPGIANLAPLLRALADAQGHLPSALHAITGPSSTGDIEMVVVKGVHGPVRVAVVAVGLEGGAG
ncbi:LutC/YkgG family protein [Desulfocurvus vexinensis]|uniref:LutC/YkgG family protein n=1 Tax=Desulfocurvus vexinensis TaxID=399548 RepID=UPI0004AD1E8A|nr:LUD domain-containing protein [Desulfocurvus vexinensis]